MSILDFIRRPHAWSWLVQDDPNPELSDWDKRDRRIDAEAGERP